MIRQHFQRAWQSVKAFSRQDVWDMDLSGLSGVRRRLALVLRILHLVGHGFKADDCRLHASALTYYTLMALVPVLVLSLALARVFGGEAIARAQVQRGVERLTAEWRATASSQASDTDASPDEEASEDDAATVEPLLSASEADAEYAADFALRIERMVDEAFEQVGRIDFATLGGIGLVMLLWMVIGVLGRVEASFNRVWGVGSERTLWRKFTDYLSVLLILPFLATAASSIPVASLIAQQAGGAEAAISGLLGADWLRRLLVLVLTSLAFAFMLIFLPNTRVRFGPGLLGGLVTALLFMLWLRICTELQVGVARYSRLYGSFATVPILLAWVFISWEIVLFGSELSYALQNADTYRMEEGGRRASMRTRLMLSLALVAECARAMRSGACLDATAFARERRISARLLNDVLSELSLTGLLAPIADKEGCFLIQHDPGQVTVGSVARALLEHGAPPEAVGLQRLDPRVREFDREWVERFEQELNRPIAELGMA